MKNNNKSRWQQAREIKRHTSRIIKLHLAGREALQRQLTRLIDENRASNSINNMTKHTVKVTLDAYRAYLEKPSEENYLNFEKFKKISDGMLSPEEKNKLNALVLAHQVCFNDKGSVKDNAIRIRCAMKDDLGAQINKLISTYPDIQTSIKIQKIINDSTITLRSSLRQTGNRQSFIAYQKTRDAINSVMRVHHVSSDDMERMNKYIDEFHGSIKAEAVAKKVRNKNITYIPGEASVSFKSETDSQDFRQKRDDIASLSGLSSSDITISTNIDKTTASQGKPKVRTANSGLFSPRKRTVPAESKPLAMAKQTRTAKSKRNIEPLEKSEDRKHLNDNSESVGVFIMSPEEKLKTREDTLIPPNMQAPSAPSISELAKKKNDAPVEPVIDAEVKEMLKQAKKIVSENIKIELRISKLKVEERIEKLYPVLKNYANCIKILERASSINEELKYQDDYNQIYESNRYKIEVEINKNRDMFKKIQKFIVYHSIQLDRQALPETVESDLTERQRDKVFSGISGQSLFTHEVKSEDSSHEYNNVKNRKN